MEILLGKDALMQIYYQKSNGLISQIVLQKGIAPNYKFRFIKLKCYSVNTSDSIVQFSKWQFFNTNGSIFQYPSGIVTGHTNNISDGFIGEEITKALTSSIATSNFPKFCAKFNSTPFEIWFDLGIKNSIDLNYFNNWRWYHSDDSDKNKGRCMTSFELYASVDGKKYIGPIDSAKIPVCLEKWTLAYEGKIQIYK